jgi:sugar O-acyltransferase (sialic acid O-acetyltransferase NeuD family)
MEKVILFGVGELSRATHVCFTHDSHYQVVAFTVDREYMEEDTLFELPVVPFDEIESIFSPSEYKMFLPISYRRMNRLRAEKYYQAKDKGYQLVSYVSSRAVVYPGTAIGDNCFISDGTIIQPNAQIGNNVIIWSGNLIGHNARIEDHCFISSHVVVGGSTVVEPYCFLGINATIRDNITIARESLIGAAALILEDTQERGVYVGGRAQLIPKPSNELRNI